MRITKIFVEKLFGVFDHEIRLNLDDRITIIHSPNGYGKTIILKMLAGLFNDRYSELKSIPYKRFGIEFEDGQKIEIEPNEKWVTKIRKDVNVYLIESQRLLSLTDGENSTKNGDSSALLSTVMSYPGKLAEVIKGALAEYASASQSLDRSFPARLVKRTSFEELTNDEFRNKLANLEDLRSHLMNLGLLEKNEEKSLPIQSQDIDEGSRRILSVYIEDTEKKLGLFDDIAKRLDLFRRIINSKFSYKEILIDREKGFLFKSNYPEDVANEVSDFLSPSSLSLGEQHELVMIYEILFQVKKHSLVLIDEPELSLHLGWQVKFLEDLQEISALADLDFLIATHAPSLIHDRWDLTVELKGVAA